MSGATLPSDAIDKAGVHGVADLAFHRRGEQTVLKTLHQRAPLRVLFPRAGRTDPPTAVVVTTSGGLVGGDELELNARVAAGAAAIVMAQAAEKVYRSTSADCRIEVRLAAAENAWLEYLPQETILFEGARLRRSTTIEVEPGAQILAGEMMVFGRVARGESLSHGFVHDAWEVRRSGRLVWADALHMDGDLEAPRSSPAGLGGAVAAATLVYTGDDPVAHLEFVRILIDAQADDDLRAAATVVGGLLVVRWLGRDPLRLRNAFGTLWAALRQRAGGLTRTLPRLWSV